MTYCVVGGVLPAIAQRVIGAREGFGPAGYKQPLLALAQRSCGDDRRIRAVLAVLSTCAIIALSAQLVRCEVPQPAALAALSCAALLEWAVLDGTAAALALGLVLAIFGPIAELPFVSLGAWHYIAPDYFPLHGLLPDATNGLSSLTGPCYFAVTTDALALGRCFERDFDD